jgi:TolC family type I secretion outer membrane protein
MRRGLVHVSVALAFLFTGACASIPPRAGSVSPAPSAPWTPPEAGKMPERAAAPPVEIPPEYLKPGTTLSLGQLIDIALKNNPATREAWHAALAAASEVGSKRSLYYPYVEIDGSILREKQPLSVGGQFSYLQTTYGPSIAASWLLFNFGGREADVAEATRALYAADWTHNAAIQDVVLLVAQAYYQYLNAKAQVVARNASLEEARNNLEAAEERHRAGVATIADELQARTAASQVELDLQDAQGQVQIIRGALATAVGVSANVPVDVGELPQELPLDAVKKTVDELIASALARRPDLAAERFRVLAAESHIHAAAIDGLPSLTLDANGNRTFYWRSGAVPFSTNWAGAITLRIPVFRGFDTAYQVQKAREEAETARATAERTEDQVILDVWSSYYAVKTASQRVKTTRDLLASATQSAEVAQGRYKAGVGSILDLLTAQSALAEARSQDAQARSLWFLSIAQLAHATGMLDPTSPEVRSLPALTNPPAPSTPPAPTAPSAPAVPDAASPTPSSSMKGSS